MIDPLVYFTFIQGFIFRSLKLHFPVLRFGLGVDNTMKDHHQANDFNLPKLLELCSKEGNFWLKTLMMITHSLYLTQYDYLKIEQLKSPLTSYVLACTVTA